jgi:Calpain family cysteine protease
MLLEKAWAKLYGSYSRIEAGFCCHAAQQLLGIPSASFGHVSAMKDIDSFWKNI